MTNLASLIMPLIGGYWFISVWNLTKYKAYRDTGYRLFFGSAFFGLIFLVAAKPMTSIIFIFFSNEFVSKWLIPTGHNLESTLSMMLGIGLPYILNFFFDPRKQARRIAEDRGNLFYVTICEAFDKNQLIELTMRSDKVYIGFPKNLVDLDNECVSVIPYASGYRDNETKTLKIINYYSKTIFEMSEKFSALGISYSDLSITLRMSDVSSARIFYPEIYDEFSRANMNEGM